ncbi:MAG TPA: hypothetical protein VJU79_08830 [Candidatus Dormibacteraeota bacterium]|nr:hypothetical protein [Candidatus Dormibacteraeota bacterium]
MFRRFSNADIAASIAAALGVIVSFLPWYSYAEGASRVSVNGFRASLLGDVFFLAAALMCLLVLMRLGVVRDLLRQRISQRAACAVLAGVAVASVIDQLLLSSGGTRSVAPGLILALLVSLGMVAAAWLRSLERPAPGGARAS